MDDVRKALVDIGTLLDLSESCGLKINYTKTALLFRVAGFKAQALLRELVQVDGHEKFLLIPRDGGLTTSLPITRAHTYLGVKISYYNFEQLTMKHCLRVGRLSCTRLRSVLLRRRALSLHDRVRVWSTCVKTSYTYELMACGVAKMGLEVLEKACLRDLPRIAGDSCPATLREGRPVETISVHDGPGCSSQDRPRAASTSGVEDRLTKVVKAGMGDALRQRAVTNRFMTLEGEWNFLTWNAQAKQLEVMCSLPGAKLMSCLEEAARSFALKVFRSL